MVRLLTRRLTVTQQADRWGSIRGLIEFAQNDGVVQRQQDMAQIIAGR
jgi:hypothetical protein